MAEERRRPFNSPTWVTNTGLVALIFLVGGYVARLEMGITAIHDSINSLKTRIVKIETAISIHHGVDWSERVENKTLIKVAEIDRNISESSMRLNNSIKELDRNVINTTHNMQDIKNQLKAIHIWTKQGDKIIQKSRTEQFRALAMYSEKFVSDYNRIFVNKSHNRSFSLRKGDSVSLMNPDPPGRQVEAIVDGFIEDPNNSDILLQINVKLLEDLDLKTKEGKYNLFIQSSPDALRWKSLDTIMQDINKGENGK